MPGQARHDPAFKLNIVIPRLDHGILVGAVDPAVKPRDDNAVSRDDNAVPRDDNAVSRDDNAAALDDTNGAVEI